MLEGELGSSGNFLLELALESRTRHQVVVEWVLSPACSCNFWSSLDSGVALMLHVVLLSR